MIKASSNKNTFIAAVLLEADAHKRRPAAITRDGVIVSLLLDNGTDRVAVPVITARTEKGADEIATRWARWLYEHLARQPVSRSNPDSCQVADCLPDAGVIRDWATVRRGWTVFLLQAFVENGAIVCTSKPRGYIDRAGIGGHLLVNSAACLGESIPMRLVVNSGFTMCGFSLPAANTLHGSPVVGYAVIDPDTPQSVIGDQLERYREHARAALVDAARREVIAASDSLSELAKPFNLSPVCPEPSLIQSAGESVAFPVALLPREETAPASGARRFVRHEYVAPLLGWQDPDMVRRQRDLLAVVVAELVDCADPCRDANELRRARDILAQVRLAGVPV